MGKIKDRLMEDYLAKPYEVGDSIYVRKSALDIFVSADETKDSDYYYESFKVRGVGEGTVSFIDTRSGYGRKEITVPVDCVKKSLTHIGVDPFPEERWDARIRTVNYSIDCIKGFLDPNEDSLMRPCVIDGVTVLECNWNPYVIDKDGNKQYYQRDFVWTLEQKQLLIESIYNGINCGQVLVRKHSWDYIEKKVKSGETEVGFFDIVDGKQRLGTIFGFMKDEFPDLHGNYYSDFSHHAKRTFEGSMAITYAEMKEGSTDEDVIRAFLHVNFDGVPQSKEHLDYVEHIACLMK